MNRIQIPQPFKVILVDDEPQALAGLQAILNQSCPEVSVVELCYDTSQAAAAIIRHRPDLVFLDISMPGESGIDFLKKLGTFDFDVIFATAFNQFAIEAFRLSAVDYILKPFSAEIVREAVEKAVAAQQQKRDAERYKILAEIMEGRSGRLMIPGKSGVRDVVKFEDIVYCKADGYLTHFFLKDGRKLSSSTNIGEYKSALKPFHFLSPHRSFLINMNEIVSVDGNSEELLMSNNDKIAIVRENKSEILNWLKSK
jgi:two-component system, LytTR family, response regulator